MDILVATPGQVDHDDLVRCHLCRQLLGVGQRVTALQGGHDALHPGQGVERPQGLVIGGDHVIHPAQVFQPGVLGTHTGVVQSCRYRVGMHDLAIRILHQVGAVAV